MRETPHPWPEPCLRQAMASHGQNAPVHDWTDAKWSHTVRSVLNADTSVNRDLHSSARVAHQIARERMKDHHLELERMGDNLSEVCAFLEPWSPPLEQPASEVRPTVGSLLAPGERDAVKRSLTRRWVRWQAILAYADLKEEADAMQHALEDPSRPHPHHHSHPHPNWRSKGSKRHATRFRP